MTTSLESAFHFENNQPIIVFDTGALIAGIDVSVIQEQCFCSAEVFDEVKNRFAREKLETFRVSTRNLIIPDFFPPLTQKYVSAVKQKAKETGDLKSLSDTDIGIVALCLYLIESYTIQFKVESKAVPIKLVSDDYSVQNVATRCGIENHAYKLGGIDEEIKWEIYCPACFEIYQPKDFGKKCMICGEQIKRRASKKSKPKNK
jgi:rRNA maturation endonuclease Nob1